MTEHKFTDEKIIKALEICQKAKCRGDCEDMGCPATTKHGCRFYLRTDEDYDGVIQMEMLKDALDLINRQKAEIEELTVSNERLEQILTFYTLQYGTVRDQSIVIETARVEAIKEFAERLKEKLIKGGIYPALVKNSIDDLVKEITEEQK
jgi:superfamily II DNA or RNA helicase